VGHPGQLDLVTDARGVDAQIGRALERRSQHLAIVRRAHVGDHVAVVIADQLGRTAREPVTLQPAPVNRRQIARPMPVDAPTMIAVGIR
jgi:hypothetical protein